MNESTPVVSDVTSEIQTLVVCKNCNHEFSGKYCNQCGEKVIHQQDRSIKHFLGEVFHAFTHADGKIIRNLKVILLNPGFLSKQYSEGVRKRYLNPVSMFFVVNLIYFLFPIFKSFNLPLQSQFSETEYSEWLVKPMVEERLRQDNLDFNEFAERYNLKAAPLSKIMLILLIPLGAIGFFLVNFKRKRFFADDLLVSLELVSYVLFYSIMVLPIILLGIYFIGVAVNLDLKQYLLEDNLFVLSIVILSILYFLIRVERTFYNQKIMIAFFKAVVLMAAFKYIILAYWFLLFLLTMYRV
jgi:hypothetical protein